jgi:alpha-L-fucosidase
LDLSASYAAGLTNDPKTYNPAKLDTDQWMGVMKDLGAKHATITAKHGCGFLLWPTKSTLPDGSAYGYDVGHGFGRNVLKEFTESADKAGIGHGFYYSLTNNFYLNVHSHVAGKGPALPKQQLVTQSQFEEIALAQVTELINSAL